MAQAGNGRPNKFITLTSRYRPEEMTPDAAAKQLVHAWRMVVQRGKRDGVFQDIQYICVFELTKKGWPHLHILARCTFLAQEWLSDRLRDYADSPIVHVRAINSEKRAAWYVAKYTAKAPEKFHGCKRYWRTHGYDLSPKHDDKPIHDHFIGYLDMGHITEVAGMYHKHNYQVEWDGDYGFLAIPQGVDLHAPAREAHQRKTTGIYKGYH